MRTFPRWWVWVLWGAVASPLGVGAQSVETWLAEEAAFHAPHRPDSALAVLEAALAVHPQEYELLWRACSEALTVAMLATDETARAEGYAAAVAFGRSAVAANPSGSDGRAWLAAALGRHALDQGPRSRVRMANEIFDLAVSVVSDDPGHNLAQHVLGQWHAEILRSGRVTRFLARRLLGGNTFSKASWDEAVVHLRAATRAEPRALIHGFELARVYVDLERPDAAREELIRVLALPDAIATDPERRLRAQALLDELN